MRFTFDKSLDYSQSQWANENSKKKTNFAKRGKTQVTRSHLIGWESGGKFSRPITVGSKVKPLQHRISFDIQLKISLYTDTYELKRINFNDKRILYLFVIREWRRWRSNCPTFLHTLCGGQRIRNGLHLTCHWNKRKQQRVIMLSGSEKEKIHPFHWRKWAVLEDSTDLNLVILGWISKVIYDCFWFALLRSVIGPKHQHHLLNQSNSK